MYRRDHLYFTFLFSLIFYTYSFYYFFPEIHNETLKLILFASLVFLTAQFSWLPDIDIRITRAVSDMCQQQDNIFDKIFCFFEKPILALLEHRTLTHSLLPLILVGSIWYIIEIMHLPTIPYYLLKVFTISIFFALIFHILGDMWTVSGVPLFWPLSKKKFRFFRFNSSRRVHVWFMRILYLFLFIVFLYFVLNKTNYF
jgi:membrane-bound metal-dependent hydrolase YbcI (DUF457 family)